MKTNISIRIALFLTHAIISFLQTPTFKPALNDRDNDRGSFSSHSYAARGYTFIISLPVNN